MRAELAHLMEARGIACIRIETYGSVASVAEADRLHTVTQRQIIRRCVNGKDGLYGILVPLASSSAILQRKKDELFEHCN